MGGGENENLRHTHRPEASLFRGPGRRRLPPPFFRARLADTRHPGRALLHWPPPSSMNRLLFACLPGWFALTAAAAPLLAPTPDETALVALTHAFDRALAQPDAALVATLLHRHYTYTGPELPPTSPAATTAAARRMALGGAASTDLFVRLVYPTAVVTGSYFFTENVPSPRFVTRGRFTATWIQADGHWALLAEHRSLGDVLEWAPSPLAQTRAGTTTPHAPAAPSESAPAAPFASTDQARKTGREESRRRHGHLPKAISQLFRSYEPTQLGYTKDRGDDPFMDFTFSAMFPLPLFAGDYPDPIRHRTDEPFFRPTRYTGPNLYFAGTLRAGQYIGTRPSSPVVGKRFNPLLALRFWAQDLAGRRESEDNFLEFVYAHESNGQFIASPGRFHDQLRVYLNQAADAPSPDAATLARSTALASTRDNISRGWDYVGLQFARDWDSNFFDSWAPEATIGLRVKLNYYLRQGLLQGDAEQFNAWEATPGGFTPDPEGKARQHVDGLSFRYTLSVAPPRDPNALTGWSQFFRFERRYAFTWTTGYAQPFRYNTIKAESGLNIYGLPLMLWYRYGYNSDLVDYYRHSHSYGLTLSFWNF